MRKPKYTVEKGEVYGELTVLEAAGVAGNGHRMWLCRCSCGRNCLASAANLKRGTHTRCERCKMEGIYERRRARREAQSKNRSEKEERKNMKAWAPVDKSKFNDDWMFERAKDVIPYSERQKAERNKKRKQYYRETGK